jgi:hypothetical protein
MASWTRIATEIEKTMRCRNKHVSPLSLEKARRLRAYQSVQMVVQLSRRKNGNAIVGNANRMRFKGAHGGQTPRWAIARDLVTLYIVQHFFSNEQRKMEKSKVCRR